jgi:hypothetical protein
MTPLATLFKAARSVHEPIDRLGEYPPRSSQASSLDLPLNRSRRKGKKQAFSRGRSQRDARLGAGGVKPGNLQCIMVETVLRQNDLLEISTRVAQTANPTRADFVTSV